MLFISYSGKKQLIGKVDHCPSQWESSATPERTASEGSTGKGKVPGRPTKKIYTQKYPKKILRKYFNLGVIFK